MFTGIVEDTGTVAALERSDLGGRLTLEIPDPSADIGIGESLAVNGCCLTVAERENGAVFFDILEQTLRVTNLGDLGPGDEVNLERALLPDTRLSGHFVQGHVDGVSEILALEQEGPDHRLVLELSSEAAPLVIPKGSITVDGISLTVAELDETTITLWIIPHTHAVTNLRFRRAGERVNLEFDMLGKYVQRLRSLG